MTLPELIRTARWMARDTFRQSIASKLLWVMLAVTGVATAVCLSVGVSGDPPAGRAGGEVPAVLPEDDVLRIGLEQLAKDKVIPEVPADPTGIAPALRKQALAVGGKKAAADGVRVAAGEISVGFGLVRVPLARSREDAVRYYQVLLAAVVADTAGVLLALLWTAGFLPTFLEPQSATVLLAKPAPRWAILLGKYAGVVLFVAVQAVLFVAATWLALGVRTGVWAGGYWLAVPLLVVNFGVFYAVSAFLAVWTRSTVGCAFGVLLFWLVCWATNYAHHSLAVAPAGTVSPAAQTLSAVGYWVLPKPLDMDGIFYDAMRAGDVSTPVAELAKLKAAGLSHPELSVLASVLFAAVTLGLAAYEFRETDY